MLRCILVDDEPLALTKCQNYLARLEGFEHVASCTSAAKARTVLAEQHIDLALLDINMPGENGLTLARHLLGSDTHVIFITAHDEFAIEGYRVEALDYLLKPFDFTQFETTLLRAKQRIQQRAASYCPLVAQQATADEVIFIHLGINGSQGVKLRSLRYIEANGNYCLVHTADLDKPLQTLAQLQTLLDRLPQDKFIRIHRSHIINIARIRTVQRQYVTLDDGTTLNIGAAYRQAFANKLTEIGFVRH
ncbi:MAG: LytTR family DNA-binding domain-containing protein [Bacteroidales bacterium]|nr:LytTR family DNA-binding domain-containing protein [Bacteroidales bacterium]